MSIAAEIARDVPPDELEFFTGALLRRQSYEHHVRAVRPDMPESIYAFPPPHAPAAADEPADPAVVRGLVAAYDARRAYDDEAANQNRRDDARRLRASIAAATMAHHTLCIRLAATG